MLLAFAGLIVTAQPASADEPFATEGSVDSIDFVSQQATSGTLAQLTGDWSIADHPTDPAGFSVELPPELQGLDQTFPISSPDGGTMGSCTTSQTRMVCELDPAYIAAHPTDLHGSFNLWVRVTTKVTEDTDHTYRIGDHDASVTVKPQAGRCTTECEFTGANDAKWGEWDATDSQIRWFVDVGAPLGGMTAGEAVTVVDELGANLAYSAPAVLYKGDEIGVTASGREGVVNWTPVDAADYSLSADGTTVSFAAEQGFFYRVRYLSKTTDLNAQKRYTNAATVTVGSETRTPVTSEFVSRGGSATGVGTSVGRFQLTKELTGDTENLTDMAFTVQYVVTPPEGAPIEGEFSLAAGDTWTSPDFPMDSTVHLTEVVPTEPANVTWSSAFSQNDFTMVGGSLTSVVLTNTATVATGGFTIEKSVEGSGADRVAADATFVVDYAYPAGDGFAAGSGSLTLVAGEAQTVSDLPVGAVVSFTEKAPAAVEGATWKPASFSPDSVVIGADDTVAVTVTNTLEKTPVTPSATPSTPSTSPAVAAPTTKPSGPALPATGTELPLVAGGIALALVIGGIALSVMRTRRS